jgi:hypothetical protein
VTTARGRLPRKALLRDPRNNPVSPLAAALDLLIEEVAP